MDRGLGLFAGLNVLPKTSWYSSYSHRITRKNNLFFLKTMHQLWKEKEMLSDTVNLDFTTIPYWGDDAHLENNWSGKKHCSLSSISADGKRTESVFTCSMATEKLMVNK